jgi:hypothetical protein
MAGTTSIKDKIRVSELTVAELRELRREVIL